MATPVDIDLFSDDPKTIQRQLGRRATEFARTGKVLEPGELMKLYEHRHQLKPSKSEAKLILASMLFKEIEEYVVCTVELGLRTRRDELGWYWFRRYTQKQLGDLLNELAQCKQKEVNIPASELLKIISAKKTSAPVVRKLVKDSDEPIRYAAREIIGRNDQLKAPKVLRRLTRAKEFYTRATAVAELGAHGQAQDLPRLRHMCQWDTETVRREAVWAVAKFGKREDIPFLKERLHDEAPAVRTVAAMALTRLLKRGDLERYLKRKRWLSFEELVEFDFVLYGPNWLLKAKPRVGDNDIGMELQMIRAHCPEW